MCDKASIMDPNKFWTVKVKKKKKWTVIASIYHELVLNFLYLIKPSSKPPQGPNLCGFDIWMVRTFDYVRY